MMITSANAAKPTLHRLLVPLARAPQLATIAWFQFLIQYRRTVLGPLWVLLGPGLFILILGLLYAEIGNAAPALFLPHLTVGLVVWTLISGFVTRSTTVFQRARPQILQGGMGLDDIVMVDVFSIVLQFLHQVILIALVLLVLRVGVSWSALLSLLGLALVIANGIWLSQVFGILGARYRDLTEIVQAVMRIAFLATPIIWLPGAGARGGVMDAYLALNPFYHFLEIVRAPLLGTPISLLSWAIVLITTCCGFALARMFRSRFDRYVPLWI